jgi:hypothetical protein
MLWLQAAKHIAYQSIMAKAQALPLADASGRRKLFLQGVALFTCAFASASSFYLISTLLLPVLHAGTASFDCVASLSRLFCPFYTAARRLAGILLPPVSGVPLFPMGMPAYFHADPSCRANDCYAASFLPS